MSLPYKHLLFDLDKTIYDFDRSSYDTLLEAYEINDLSGLGISDFDLFMEEYRKINPGLWELYRKGEIKKEVLNWKRFFLTLEEFNISDIDLAKRIAKHYVTESPRKKALFPDVLETLEYLAAKYTMHIITNGFEEVQFTKIETQGIGPYFQKIITSEEAGVKKPDPYIFEYALSKAGARAVESLMIGDDLEVDIIGARNAGIDQVYVNYPRLANKEKISYEIFNFKELMEFL